MGAALALPCRPQKHDGLEAAALQRHRKYGRSRRAGANLERASGVLESVGGRDLHIVRGRRLLPLCFGLVCTCRPVMGHWRGARCVDEWVNSVYLSSSVAVT